MTLHAHPVAETQAERELREIDALMMLLLKKRIWLDKATYWQRLGIVGNRQWANCCDHAESYQGDILLAAAALFDSDELYVRAGEVGA